jgi:DNA-binding NtrC family response regulator
LLRFLQEKEYRPLGARKPRRTNVRVIAASNIFFEDALAKGRFRQDLYYRLNVLPMTLPPLRERLEDVLPLARHFVEKYAAEFQQSAREIAPAAMQKLLTYAWPGNVRELENVVQRAMVLCETATIQANDIVLTGCKTQPASISFRALKAEAVAQFERGYLQAVLREHRGNINAAARAAQKNRRAFWELLRKHQMLPRPESLQP